MSAHRSMVLFRVVLGFIINLAKIFPGELLSAYFRPGMRELEAAGLTNVKLEYRHQPLHSDRGRLARFCDSMTLTVDCCAWRTQAGGAPAVPEERLNQKPNC